MNSKERVRAVLDHKQPDRFPVTLEAQSEVMDVLMGYFGLEKPKSDGNEKIVSFQSAVFGIEQENEIRRKLGVDLVIVATPTAPQTVGNWFGLPLKRRLPDGKLEGAWGIIFKEFQYPFGTYIEIDHAPLEGVDSYEKLAAHPKPDLDLYDFAALGEILPKYKDFYTILNMNGCFDFARFMRGTEQFLLDLALEPRKAEVLLDKVNEFAMDYLDRCMEKAGGMAEAVFCGDDFGSQKGLLISPAMWRKYIKPRYKILIEHVHKHGLKYLHHSCGGIRPIISDMVEIGTDILNPIQPLAAGMDPEELGKEFGKDLVFYGGIDEQHTLPYGTPQDVMTETRHCIDTLGMYNGYIVSPSHAFQPDTPLENLLAMYTEVLGYKPK